ncbi:MAG: 6-bladed beta-propeller [Salinivirgaceae bacterium]|nr:6-bladed beta-propeller [Salinivirgaceae bacterium]
MKKASLFALAAAMFAACNTQQEQTISTLRIDTDKVTEADTVDCIIDTTSLELVILETTDDCLLGSATQIGYRGDTIIIFDKPGQSILFFDSKGHYLSKIHRVGRSRTEYVEINDLCFTNDEVIIYDWEGKIVAYGFDGKFRYSFEVPHAQSICAKDGNILVAHGWNTNEDADWGRVSVYNKKGERLAALLKIDEADANRSDWSDEKYINGFGDSLFFMAPTDNVVYKYENSDFVPAYQFDFGDDNLPAEVAREGAMSKNPKNYSYAYEFRETERFRFAGFHGANQKFLISWIFDKKENKTIVMSKSIMFKSILWPEIKRIDDCGNYISGYIPISAAKFLQAEFYKKLGDKSIWPKEVASLPDDDNGVIVRVRLKNFNDD